MSGPYDTHAPRPAGDYSRCRSAADIESVLQPLPPREPLDWVAGMKVVHHPASAALDKHPRLAALAEAKRRVPEVLDALERIQGGTDA